jgi:hypothetical protein
LYGDNKFIFFSPFLLATKFLRFWLCLVALINWLVQLTQQLTYDFEAKQEQFIHQEPACEEENGTQTKLIVSENLEIFKTLPKKHTEITMNTDDRKENAAFKPSIKFISCFLSD